MAKKLKKILKLQLPAGAATPAPPVGPALGAEGINLGQFINQFNQLSASQKGNILSVVVNVYEDRSFDIKIKTPVTSDLLKKAAKIEKGSGQCNRDKVGKISRSQLEEIAKIKMPDLNVNSLEAAIKVIAGTAKQMGIELEK
ncbi:MAG: 50S ribosomal protein L11 [candidate division WOR-3 bacterium]